MYRTQNVLKLTTEPYCECILYSFIELNNVYFKMCFDLHI